MASSIKFCAVCDNMLYLSLDADSSSLKQHCRNCGFSELIDPNHSYLVSETALSHDQASYKQYMTKYIQYDPTLPRVNNIACPNDKCPTNADNSSKEVIYIKYDQLNMKYLYFCCKCETFWKN